MARIHVVLNNTAAWPNDCGSMLVEKRSSERRKVSSNYETDVSSCSRENDALSRLQRSKGQRQRDTSPPREHGTPRSVIYLGSARVILGPRVAMSWGAAPVLSVLLLTVVLENIVDHTMYGNAVFRVFAVLAEVRQGRADEL